MALFRAVTKWRRVVERAREIPAAVREALTSVTTGRPAPAALIGPENVLDEIVAPLDWDLSDFSLSDTRLPRKRPLGDPAMVFQAADILAHAKQPAILAGSGVLTSAAWAELASLAEKAGIAVATTIHGKGAIADSNPWSLGTAGNNGAREHANRYVREADAVLLVGTRANATDTNSWTGPTRRGVPVIQIDIDAERAGRNFPEAVRIVADARVALKQLFDAIIASSEVERERRRQRVACDRTRWEEFRLLHWLIDLAAPSRRDPAKLGADVHELSRGRRSMLDSCESRPRWRANVFNGLAGARHRHVLNNFVA
jgi:acetolactate synthase-1/2/3 large subunit